MKPSPNIGGFHRTRATPRKRAMMASATAACVLGLALGGSAAAQSPPSQGDVAKAALWAERLWEDARAFVKKGAEKARIEAEKAERGLAEARNAREKVEAAIAQARTRVAEAGRREAELRARTRAAEGDAARTRSLLEALADSDGSISNAVRAAIRSRLPEYLREAARRAAQSAESETRARRSELRALLAKELAQVAVDALTRDETSLRRIARTAVLRSTRGALDAAEKAFGRALSASAKGIAAAQGAISAARTAVDTAIPAQEAIERTIENALRRLAGAAASAAAAIVYAPWRSSQTPADAGATADVAALAAYAHGARKALPEQPPARASIERVVDVGPARERIQAAARALFTEQSARKRYWSAALDSLLEVSKEVSR
jgi:hypothetical protein